MNNGINKYRTIPGEPGKPPSLLEVSDTQLGRSDVLRPDQTLTLINAQGNSFEGYVATIHAQVGELAFPAVGTDRRAPVIADLIWGQGGAQFAATIDLRTGIAASLVATSVQLVARFEANDAGAPDQRATQARVSAAVVWGDRPARAPVTRTLPRVTVGIAGSATFAVPAFAYSVAFLTANSGFYAAGSTNLITLHGGPAITDDPELAVTTGQLGTSALTLDGLLLSGATRYVTLANTSGAPLIVRPVFRLAL